MKPANRVFLLLAVTLLTTAACTSVAEYPDSRSDQIYTHSYSNIRQTKAKTTADTMPLSTGQDDDICVGEWCHCGM
ncbi:MAG: hypothetical protein AB7E52_04460 [Bdellovibrionales bacterium]